MRAALSCSRQNKLSGMESSDRLKIFQACMPMQWSIVDKPCMSHPVIQALAYIHRSSTAYADKRASVLAPPCAGRVSYVSCSSH